MERVGEILRHEAFRENLRRNREAEADRRFCRHDMVHFLDVARIGRIINLEEGLGIEEERIYAAALLHDLGKHLQYTQGIPHEQAGVEIAGGILKDCGFGAEETAEILDAISCHRNKVKEEGEYGAVACHRDKVKEEGEYSAVACQRSGVAPEKAKAGLRELLYRADKASRPCFCCEVREECNWKEQQKNLELRY